MKILVLNAGSSSQKAALYDWMTPPLTSSPPLWSGQVDWTHQAGAAELLVSTSRGERLQEVCEHLSRAAVVGRLLAALTSGPTQVLSTPEEIAVVGHRVVHGGPYFSQSVPIDGPVLDRIRDLTAFAPLHHPAIVEGIEAVTTCFGARPQVAVFDTAFHAHLPQTAALYPGPYQWWEQGIRRYGFHGISHQYCAQRAAQLLGQDLASLRLVICHLGNGCSLSAVAQGRSVDTTMGFTPLEGLMMGTRSGSVDPGILLYLLRTGTLDAATLERVLSQESGLLGVSGISADLRRLLAAREAGHERAHLALQAYVHRIRAGIGAMVGSLGGLDVLVFTAGVGEHSPWVRQQCCQPWECLGLRLDDAANDQAQTDQDVADPSSRVRVLVIKTEEDWAIAQECWRLAGEC